MTVEQLCELLGVKVERWDRDRWFVRATRSSRLVAGPAPASVADALARLGG